MPCPIRPRLHINWELLRTEARLVVGRQPGWLAAGLLGPLAITLYTLFRYWEPNRGERDLLQAALLLSGWNTVYAIVYIIAAWLRPKQEATEREQLHLPLSAVHFALRRLIHACAVPLSAALLSLPLWGILLLFYQVPYGVGGSAETDWNWLAQKEVGNPWWVRLAWIAVCIFCGMLMPIALTALLDLLTPQRYLRCALLLATPVGMYCAVRLAAGWDYAITGWWGTGWGSFGPLVMNYRQTRGVSPWPYLVFLGLVICAPVLIGWLRPAWRWLLLSLPVLLLAAFMLRKALPESVRSPLRPISSTLFNRDARYAAGLFIGHLSPPRDIRLLLYSYPSNVLFGSQAAPVEPSYPQQEYTPAPERKAFASDDAFAQAQQDYDRQTAAEQKKWEAAYKEYQSADDAYQKAYARLPRLALWVGAGLYPLLLPLWVVTGLLLGVKLRGEPVRDHS